MPATADNPVRDYVKWDMWAMCMTHGPEDEKVVQEIIHQATQNLTVALKGRQPAVGSQGPMERHDLPYTEGEPLWGET